MILPSSVSFANLVRVPCTLHLLMKLLKTEVSSTQFKIYFQFNEEPQMSSLGPVFEPARYYLLNGYPSYT